MPRAVANGGSGAKDPPVDRDRRITLAEASQRSGLSVEALRLRIRRNKLASRKDNMGRVTVRVGDLDDLVPPRNSDLGETSEPDDVPEDTTAEELAQAEAELLEARLRIARLEAEKEGETRRADDAEARVTTAEGRADSAEAALREATTPLVLRVVRALRRRE